MTSSSDTVASEKNLKTLTHVVYALQALGFLVAITWIVAVVINYVKVDETKGTWTYGEPDWAELRTVVTNHGPMSEARLQFRRDAREATRWVRDAILGEPVAA